MEWVGIVVFSGMSMGCMNSCISSTGAGPMAPGQLHGEACLCPGVQGSTSTAPVSAKETVMSVNL